MAITRNMFGDPSCTSATDVEEVLASTEFDADGVYCPSIEQNGESWQAEVLENKSGDLVLRINGDTRQVVLDILEEVGIEVQ